MGEFGKSGELGRLGSLGPSPALRAGLGFCVVRGSGYARYACAEAGVWEAGHAGKGICGSRHDREGEMGHAGKGICGVGMTGKARWVMPEREFAE